MSESDINCRIPISPDMRMPKPETDGIFLCWEGETQFRYAPQTISSFLLLPILSINILTILFPFPSPLLHFSGFVFALPHQSLAFLRHEIQTYDVLGTNANFTFVFRDAPLSTLQEDSIQSTTLFSSLFCLSLPPLPSPSPPLPSSSLPPPFPLLPYY